MNDRMIVLMAQALPLVELIRMMKDAAERQLHDLDNKEIQDELVGHTYMYLLKTYVDAKGVEETLTNFKFSSNMRSVIHNRNN